MSSSSSTGVEMGVGDDTSTYSEYAALCGRGEISMCSVKPGDDEGSGGVVAAARSVMPSMILAVKSARRGVGN